MPAKNPRISAVVDMGIWRWLRTKANREGISVSLVVRDILSRVRAEEDEQYCGRTARKLTHPTVRK